jgi:hypothetical protein
MTLVEIVVYTDIIGETNEWVRRVTLWGVVNPHTKSEF